MKKQPVSVSDETAVIYTGGGAYMPPLPARDLTVEEWLQYDANLRKLAVSLGLYKLEGEVSNDS